MEDYQEYIESGRLEQYALGELDPAAQAEVEGWAARFPQVRHELDELLAGLGVYAEAHTLAPPAGLRDRVLGRVLAEIGAEAPASVAASPLAAAPAAEAAPTMRVSASNPRPAETYTPAPAASSRSGWAIAASVALLLSLAANALLYSRWQQASTDLVAAQNSQARFAQTSQVMERRLTSTQEQLHVLRSPQEYKMVALAGTPAHASAHARVLYNVASHRVYLDVQQLPSLPAGKQYQLWALDKGKPVDAGVLAANTAAGDSLQQMKDIASAQAFAMTVEPTGGSAGPTLTTMTVIGNI
ncbi:anti-sigma factor [Hymenobacter cheonanensis]|uniref:anti-sigma factor n=1 Tax=Hymenobacter sp. CA2-7 TaxID=3063993 RepID=UPI002712F4AF|nr:anti-sigma factor [Hymenobacter sp. CA2-7]MDO7886953.1 anti-sigma factor [Hymenobacter sp. CA2-7]